jgi:hypothetical protein
MAALIIGCMRGVVRATFQLKRIAPQVSGAGSFQVPGNVDDRDSLISAE